MSMSMTVRDVIYVHGLKNNLISVSTLEDRGFVVFFQDGHVLVHPKGSSDTIATLIGIRCEKLYKLMSQLLIFPKQHREPFS